MIKSFLYSLFLFPFVLFGQKNETFECLDCIRIEETVKTQGSFFSGMRVKKGTKETMLKSPIEVSWRNGIVTLKDNLGITATINYNNTTFPSFKALCDSIQKCVCVQCCNGGSPTPMATDVNIIKSADKFNVKTGDTVTWKLIWRNVGSSAATGVVVSDVLPNGLSYISASCAYSTNTINVGNLAVNQSGMCEIKSRVTGTTGRIINTANVSTTTSETNLSNNTDTSSVLIQEIVDLALTKSVDRSMPNLNDTVEFTINVMNNSAYTALNTKVLDCMPSGLVYVSHSGGTYNNVSCEWTIGSMVGMSAAQLKIKARVTTLGQKTNSASVSTTSIETNLANNVDDVDVVPLTPYVSKKAELNVIKKVYDKNGINEITKTTQNDTITWEITVCNLYDTTASSVTVADVLPNCGELILSISITNSIGGAGLGSYSGGVWTIGSLPNYYTNNSQTTINNVNGCQKLRIRARVYCTSIFTNFLTNIATATTTTAEHGDYPNSDTVSIHNRKCVFAYKHAKYFNGASIDTTVPNAEFCFIISFINNTGSTLTNFVSNEILPSGLTYVSHHIDNATGISGSGLGTYNPITGVWTIPSFPATSPNDVQTLNVTVRATGCGRQDNCITNTTFDQPEFMLCPDNTICDYVFIDCNAPKKAELNITKEATKGSIGNCDVLIDNVHLEEVFCHRIDVCNFYEDTAMNIEVRDTLPPGVQFIGATIDGTPSGTITTLPYLSRTIVVYNLASLPNRFTDNTQTVEITPPIQSCRTLKLSVKYIGKNNINYSTNNAVTTTTTTEFGDYPNQDNDTLWQCVKFEKTKTGGNKYGDTIQYLISVNNYGNNTGGGNLFTDIIPSTLTYVSHTILDVAGNPVAATYNPVTGIFNATPLPNILPQGHIILTIKAIINTPCVTISNTLTSNLTGGFIFNCSNSILNATFNSLCSSIPQARIEIKDTTISGNKDFKKLCLGGNKVNAGSITSLTTSDSFFVSIPELNINSRMKIPFCTNSPSDFTDLGTNSFLDLLLNSTIQKVSIGQCITGSDLNTGICLLYDRFIIAQVYDTWGDGCVSGKVGKDHTIIVQSYCEGSQLYSIIDTAKDLKCFGYIYPNIKTSYSAASCGTDAYRGTFVVESRHLPQTTATYLDFIKLDSATNCTSSYTDVNPNTGSSYCVNACSDCILRHKLKINIDNAINLNTYFPHSQNICINSYNLETRTSGMRRGGHIIYNWIDIDQVSCNQFRFTKQMGNDLGLYYDDFPSTNCYGAGNPNTAYPYCSDNFLTDTDYGVVFRIFNQSLVEEYSCEGCPSSCDKLQWGYWPLYSSIITLNEGIHYIRTKYRTLDCVNEIMESESPILIYSY